MASGSQKFVIDLVLRMSLLKISTISNPGVMFIDEGFGSLDDEYLSEVCNILK